jgi:ubiquitin C-terminal hydrolase
VTNCYEPLNFKGIISSKNPLFKGINPNDSKDLINFLLEEMNHELSNLNPSKQNNFRKKNRRIDQTNKILTYNDFKSDFIENNNSKIAKIFFFTIESRTLCQGCNILKYNYQALYLLEFQLESVFNFCLSNNMNQINNNGQKYVTLLQCFEQYRSPTYFVGENSLYCNNCKSQQSSTYINNIYSLPPTLIIVLNRGKGNSFDCYVDFPAKLNLQQYVVCPQSITSYQLRGVITHLGESGMSGHFIAFCKHRIDNNWYCYNDAIVSYCNDQRNGFRKGTPYILFYDSLNGNNNVLYDNNNIKRSENLNFKNNMINNNNFINNCLSNKNN